ERAGEFADQQGRLIDLCGDEDAGGLDVELRSYLRELGTREVATYLDAERKAAQRLLAAGVDTADLGFPRLPTGDRLLRLADGVIPEAAPAGGEQHDHDDEPDIFADRRARTIGASGGVGSGAIDHGGLRKGRMRHFHDVAPRQRA